MTDTCCDICGDLLNDKCVIKLNCNHSFHYECVMKTFLADKKKINQFVRRDIELKPNDIKVKLDRIYIGKLWGYNRIPIFIYITYTIIIH